MAAGHAERGFLMAFSGQIADRASWPGFVPPVFDYLQPDGYFKQEEARITQLNRQEASVFQDSTYLYLMRAREALQEETRKAVLEARAVMRMGKQLRDQRRREGFLSATEQAEMIRESQYQKAEVHRTKQHYADLERDLRQKLEPYEIQLQQLRKERRERSEALQRWLFSQFEMLNAAGEKKALPDIFAATPQGQPPAGAGECCEPRLLQYAYAQGMKPIQLAMFWYGPSPRDEVRHHLRCYPACRGKCKPILEWMMMGYKNADAGAFHRTEPHGGSPTPLPLLVKKGQEDASFLVRPFGDGSFLILRKPAGLLSVPGKGDEPSVYSWVRDHYPQAEGPLIVHRLDQDTSGLMVVALTKEMHRLLQQLFLRRQVEKTYIAELERPVLTVGQEGIISLPLLPDPDNRPYQRVDHEKGKKAVTRYRALTASRLLLWPLTGRTHQLRVHCAHEEGLGCPIKGDRLYGCSPVNSVAVEDLSQSLSAIGGQAMSADRSGTRLCLHASRLAFLHPLTHEPLVFEWEAPF